MLLAKRVKQIMRIPPYFDVSVQYTEGYRLEFHTISYLQ